MKIHHASVAAYAHEEDVKGVREAVEKILPEGVAVAERVLEPEMEGEVFTHNLYAIEARLEKKKAEDFFNRIMSALDEYDRKQVAGKKELRVDDDCTFYVRLSKREAAEGRFVLDSRDSIHVGFKIAAYPARKENALKVLEVLMEDAGVC